jgi:hypothetical protein
MESRVASSFPLVIESPPAYHIRRAVPPLASPLFLFPVSRTRRSRRPGVCTATMSRATVYPASSVGEDLAAFSLAPLPSSQHLAVGRRSSLPVQPPSASPPRTRAARPRCTASALDTPLGHLALGRVAVGRVHHCASRSRWSCSAGPPLDSACGLCFIFLFSEYNQINANSKICTSFI